MEKSEKGLTCGSCEHCYHDLPARKAGRKPKLACLHPDHGSGGKPLAGTGKAPAGCPLENAPEVTDKGTLAPTKCVDCESHYPAKEKAKALCTTEQPPKAIDDAEKIPSWCPRGYGKGKKAKADDGGDAGKGSKKGGKKSKAKPKTPPADPPAGAAGGSPPPGE